MYKAKNIVFLLIIAIVCFSVVGYKAADKLDILPPFLDNGTRSYLEGRELQSFPEISATAFFEGTLQTETESYLSDCIPARNEIVVINAKAQNSMIRIANIPFGFDVYPTYFGSGVVYSETYNALFVLPSKISEGDEEKFAKSAENISKLSEKHPDTQFTVYIPDRSLISSANPAIPYVANPIDYNFIESYFAENLSEKVSFNLEKNYRTENYHKHYYLTDHHWNIDGAYDAYQVIAKELDLDIVETGTHISYPQYLSYGSLSRNGLFLIEADYITDYEINYPQYSVWKDGKKISRNNKDNYRDSSVDAKRAKYNGYAYYFGGDYPRLVYSFENNEDKGNLLIIGDSFTQPLEPMLASSYNKTHVIDARFFQNDIDKYISDNDISDVVILMSSNNISASSVTQFFSTSSQKEE